MKNLNVQNYDLLIFLSDDNYYAIETKRVKRVIRVVNITPSVKSPFYVLGVFNLHGKTLPVISLRRLFSLADKNIELEDMLILTYIGGNLIALLTDSVLGVYECKKDENIDSKELFSELVAEEIVQWNDKLIPVIDMQKMIDKEILNHIENHSKNETKKAQNV